MASSVSAIAKGVLLWMVLLVTPVFGGWQADCRHLVRTTRQECQATHGPQQDYTPTFDVDYGKCSELLPLVSGNAVTFGSGDTCRAGRVVSTKRYQNITKITATIDLSRVSQNMVNAAFYMVANPTAPGKQPKADNYCDAGGNNNGWNCRELDFIETNGNKISQTSMHLENGGEKAPQRWEFAFAETAKPDSCFYYDNMVAAPTPANGLHSLVSAIDMTRPFTVVTTFTYGAAPGMKTALTQAGVTVVVYDTAVGSGAEGSELKKFADLIPTMNDGYWLLASFWQGYSPQGPGSKPWWNVKCKWGDLCNTSGFYWGISDIVVTAERELP